MVDLGFAGVEALGPHGVDLIAEGQRQMLIDLDLGEKARVRLDTQAKEFSEKLGRGHLILGGHNGVV